MDENTEHPGTSETPGNPDIAEPKARFRDRVLGMRGVAAVALAGVILGGAGGGALGAGMAGHDRDQMQGRPGMDNRQFPDGPRGGQFPSTTAPEGNAS
jgi:hypothetical protein